MSRRDAVLPALLRYWRQQRGMSQLDLGLAADVSARHISFLETGRSQPSVEMVGLLAETLDVPLRDRNELLRAAGFEPLYPEPDIDVLLDGALGAALDAMLAHHDPYPMLVFDRLYNVVRTNGGGELFLAAAGTDGETPNLLHSLFDESGRALVTNWDEVAGDILRRLQREVMHRPNDEELAALLASVLARPELPPDWRSIGAVDASLPTTTLRASFDGVDLGFLVTITAFSAPSNVTLDELKIEAYLPLDDATRSFFDAALA